MRVVDSHTGGEPTRVIVEGAPLLRSATMLERREELQRDWDHLRTAIASEPRASEGTVVAFLTEPEHPFARAGVIFADRAEYLGMCGHGTMGVVRTLAYLDRVALPMEHSRDAVLESFYLDTPAGTIHAKLYADGSVEIQNVPSLAYRLDVTVAVPEIGEVTGDIAYGGNWFFLVNSFALGAQNIPQLTALASRVHDALRKQNITGENGVAINHVVLFGPPQRADADAKNFVLCPDGAYDRSPCGTGTSAKMAVLAARGALQPGEFWRQESIVGSLFTGHIETAEQSSSQHTGILPFIRGHAYITGETTLHFDPEDPFRYGIKINY